MATPPAEHGPTFLGEDLPAWRAAAILAVATAIAWEIATALTRKVTLRLPFLVLYLAWFSTPRADRKLLIKVWKAELWSILKRRDRSVLTKFCKGMAFAVPLALGAARATAKASREPTPRRRLAIEIRRPSRILVLSIVNSAAATGIFWQGKDWAPIVLLTVVSVGMLSASLIMLTAVFLQQEAASKQLKRDADRKR